MKKKGFIFAETIIVLTVVSIGLIMLYTTFSRVLRREKARASYNQPIDIYHLNTIKNYLQALEVEYPGGKLVPRGPLTGIRNINTGLNSSYFRLECQCSEQIKKAVQDKYGFVYCTDNFDHTYSNFCADLNNHLNVRDIYIIKNSNIKQTIGDIINDEKEIEKPAVDYEILLGGKKYVIYRYRPGSNINGIARKVNASLVDYMHTLYPLKSTVPTDDWSNDFIIIGEFYRDGKYTYASLRYEG